MYLVLHTEVFLSWPHVKLTWVCVHYHHYFKKYLSLLCLKRKRAFPGLFMDIEEQFGTKGKIWKRVNFRKISEIWDHSITGQCTINLGKWWFIWKCMSWPWNIFSKAQIWMNFIQKVKERKIFFNWEVDSRHCFLHLRSFGYLLPSFRFGKTHGQ